MFEDLVLKAQGESLKADPDFRSLPIKIMTPFAYLSPPRFKTAEFLTANPYSTSRDIRLALGVLADTMSACLGNMFYNDLVNRDPIQDSRNRYYYTLSIGKFEPKYKMKLKKLAKNEHLILEFAKNIKAFNSTDAVIELSIESKNIFYPLRTLRQKRMIKVRNKEDYYHIFSITSKGKNTLENGGVYEV